MFIGNLFTRLCDARYEINFRLVLEGRAAGILRLRPVN